MNSEQVFLLLQVQHQFLLVYHLDCELLKDNVEYESADRLEHQAEVD